MKKGEASRIGARVIVLLVSIFGIGGCHRLENAVFSLPARSLARQWIESVEAQDFDSMASLLHAEASYEDPTARHFGEPVILQGAEAIVDFWRKSSEVSDAEGIRYELRGGFEVGGVTVLNLTFSLTGSGPFWGVARERISVQGDQTTVIVVEDGKIIRAIDYVDYASMEEGVERQRREFGSSDSANDSKGEE